MRMDIFASEDKNPKAQTNTQIHNQHFARYRNDYIAWALTLLEQQRKTLAQHISPAQTDSRWTQSSIASPSERRRFLRPADAAHFAPRKQQRSLGSVE